jgi:hypothetical protein
MLNHLDVFHWRLLFLAAFAFALAVLAVAAIVWRALRARRRRGSPPPGTLSGTHGPMPQDHGAPGANALRFAPLPASRGHAWTSSSWH